MLDTWLSYDEDMKILKHRNLIYAALLIRARSIPFMTLINNVMFNNRKSTEHKFYHR
jgi:hypothetical protein